MSDYVDEDKQEMVRDFVNEGRELLDDAEPQIIDMEKTAIDSGRVDDEILNAVFRLFHSLKGTASFLDFQTIIGVTHEAETILDIFRRGKTAITPYHVDILCRTADFVRSILDVVERKYSDEGFEEEADALIDDLRQAIGAISDGEDTLIGIGTDDETGEEEDTHDSDSQILSDLEALLAPPPPACPPGGEPAALPPDDSRMAPEDRLLPEVAPETAPAGPPAPDEAGEMPPGEEYAPQPSLETMGLRITPEMIKSFTEESMELCEDAEGALLSLERASGPEPADRAFRAFHSIKGNAGFFGYAKIERISHLSENVLDGIRNQEKTPDSTATSVLLTVVDALRTAVGGVTSGGPENVPEYEQLSQSLERLADQQPETGIRMPKKNPILDILQSAPKGWEPEAATGGGADALPGAGCMAGEPTAFPVMPEIELQDENPQATPDDPGSADQASGEPIEDSPPSIQAAPDAPPPVAAAPSPQGRTPVSPGQVPPAADTPTTSGVAPGSGTVIRVDIDKLDKMLDLVGELVIAESMVANNQAANGLKDDRFGKAVTQLDKISREIQEVAMSMRMIPLAGVFRKMVRLVRDLSNKAGKQVDLQITGEETEVDKTIIEQISDPLVHLIRNAVDHGLETPAERRIIGKPETGRVAIEAKHSAGEVWITVEDDGKGLDRDRIFRKGLEKGLVKSEDKEMKDEDVWRLIFEPGFSTAEQISNISGRGVGMDVVRQNIEKLRGKIDIRTRAGIGTMFAVRIPLTLAIIEGMVVRVGVNRYTIPISSIKESFRPGPDQITRTPDGLEIVRIRGELQPVLRLHELYQVEPRYYHLNEGILIMVENSDNKCCIFVDELLGQQQIVIKGLPGYLNHIKGISGCAILGDGEVSLILDIADMISSIDEIVH